MSKEYENQNVSYVIHGNYHLPCITVKEQNELHIGVWANRHRQYLKQHHTQAVVYGSACLGLVVGGVCRVVRGMRARLRH